jgi:hypothetical protein
MNVTSIGVKVFRDKKATENKFTINRQGAG